MTADVARGLLSGTGRLDVAVSLDGRFVYVSGSGVTAFERNPRSGTLRQFRDENGCLRRRSTRCGPARHIRFFSASATTADGRHLYVVSIHSHALTVFERR